MKENGNIVVMFVRTAVAELLLSVMVDLKQADGIQ